MTVSKINGFAAPYRSLTFRQADNVLMGRNGLLRLDGPITEVGGDVTVPGLAFIQEGLLVSTDEIKVVTISSDLKEPYYLTVRAASEYQGSALIYGFAKAPEDISSGLVIVGEKANGEWRPYYKATIDALISGAESDRIDLGFSRALSGLKTTYVSPNLVVSGGLLVDKQGTKHALAGGYNFLPVSGDPDFPRVDRIVFRRGRDSYNRVGRVTQITGGTFSDAAETVAQTTLYTSLLQTTKLKSVVLDDNSVVVLAAQGFGDSFAISYTKYSADRTTEQVVPTIVIASASSDNFDANLLNNNINIVYKDGDLIKLQRVVDATGALNGAAVNISDGSGAADYPKIKTLPANSELCVVYQEDTGPLTSAIILVKKTSLGASVLTPTPILTTTGNYVRPSFDVTADSILYVAYEDAANGKVFFGRVDDIGNTIDPFVEISGATTHPVHGVLADGASNPIVKVADNKQAFVLFEQEKPSTNKGIAIYTGGSAVMADLISSSENFSHFDFAISDVYNSLNILVSDAVNGINYAQWLKNKVEFSINLAAGDSQGVTISLDNQGSLFHAHSKVFAGTYSNVGTPVAIQHIGPQPISGTNGSTSLNNNQFMVATGSEPQVGQQVTVAGSTQGNNGSFVVSSNLAVSINATNDFTVVSLTSAFVGAAESDPANVSAQYANPDGNQAEFIKSISEKRKRAYLNTELDTDILLARVIQPGNVILNYIPHNQVQSNSDVMGIFGDVTLGWENTGASQLQIAGTLQVLDFINNLEYQIAGGTFMLNEGEALYAIFDGNNLAPTYQIASIDEVEWDQPIQVMGFIKGGKFYPHFLLQGDIGTLSSGEVAVVGTDLPQATRTRLGIVTDTSMESYSSTDIIGVNDSYPAALSKLDAAQSAQGINKNYDRTLKLVGGGAWYWDKTNNNLIISADAYIQIAGFTNDRNTIAAANSPFTILDGEVAVASVNRTNDVVTTLTLTIGSMATFVPTDDSFIVARRVGSDVYLANGIRLKPDERVEIDAVLAELDKFLRRLEMRPVPGNPKRIRITKPESTMLDGSKVGQVIGSLMLDPLFEAQIEPTTGNVFKGDGVTALTGINPLFTPPTVVAGQYRWLGVSLVPHQLNSVGEMEASVLVLPASADGASLATATKDGAVLGGDIPVGWFYIQRNAADTDIENITYSNIVRVPVSGGSGGGSGDATTALGRLEDLLDDSFYQFLEPNVFSIDQKDKLSSTTGSYSYATKTLDVGAGGNLVSYSLLDQDYLAELSDLIKAQVVLIFDKDNVDSNPVVELTPDGDFADLQPVLMNRIDVHNDTYVGEVVFDLAALTLHLLSDFAIANEDAVIELEGAAGVESLSQSFTTGTSVRIAEQLTLYVDKAGTPSGYLLLNFHEDNAGNPGAILSQTIIDVSALSAGPNTLTEVIGRHVMAPSSKYHISLSTDANYKASFVSGTTAIRLRVDSTGPGAAFARSYNGTVWSEFTGSAAPFIVEGRALDLKMKYTTTDASKLVAYGVYYGEEAVSVQALKKINNFVFNGTLDKATYNQGFDLTFDADPNFLEIVDIHVGQKWLVPAFSLQGNKVVFPPDFWDDRGAVHLIARQIEAGSFDGNPENTKLLVENHLGSNDPALDHSVPGRGIMMAADVTAIKVEITVDENYSLVIKQA